MYYYEKFPKLDESRYSMKKRLVLDERVDSHQNLRGLEEKNKITLMKVDLKSLDDDCWSLYLLEEVFTIWFICFNLRAKYHY